ncbi:iron transporter [Vibrio cholerae]|nr:iron transporter [Vibrio cholerae]TQP70705.1 iron transporter [Vibrio cholerae]TQQ07615.1 iron transporter [Vibrio cholerae]
MVTVVVFEFSVMRCQPLRRALATRRIYGISTYTRTSKKENISRS